MARKCGKKLIIGEDLICTRHDGLVEKFDTQDQKIGTVIAKLDGLKEQITKQFTLQDEAVKAALVAADRAVSKAEIASEKRFDSVDEFRATLVEQQRNLMPRTETESLFRNMGEKVESTTVTLVEKIGVLEKSINVGSGQRSGMKEGWGYAVGVIGLVLTVLSVIILFVKVAG